MLRLRHLTKSDFPLLLEWLTKPHVKEWWDDGDDTLEKVAERYGGDQSATSESFILLYRDEATGEGELGGEKPIGYMQYEIDASGVAGIDQFIGEAEMINRGIGTQAIKLFLDYIRERHPLKVVTVDPLPTNKRAIRCYEKVGFQYDESLPSPTGLPAYMMKIEY